MLVLPRVAAATPGIRVSLSLDAIGHTSVSFSGHLDVAPSDIPYSRVVLYFSEAGDFNIHRAEEYVVTSFDAMQNFHIEIDGLKPDTAYSYCLFAESKSEQYYGDVVDFQTLASVANKRLLYLANSVADYNEPLDGRKFEYDKDGRLVMVTEFGSWGVWSSELVYDGSNIEILEDGMIARRWTLNDRGYVTVQERGNYIYDYEYDEDDYLVGVYESYSGEPRVLVSNITWEDGNMTSWSREDYRWDDELGVYVARVKRQTYSSELNVSGIFPAFPEKGGLSRWMFEVGFFGKPSKNLVAVDQWEDASKCAEFVYEYHPVTGDMFAAYKYYGGELDDICYYIWE